MILFLTFLAVNILDMCNVCARAHRKAEKVKGQKIHLSPISVWWVGAISPQQSENTLGTNCPL